MDQPEDHHNLQTVEKLNNKLQFLKRVLQFLISFSLFSMFLVVPIPSTSQFLTRILSLLSRALERKFMLLICNGILAFLAKKSVSSSSSSPSGSSALDGQLSTSNLETVTVDEELPVVDMVAHLEDDIILVNPWAAAEEEEEDEKEADEGQVEHEIKYVEKEENEGIQEEERGSLEKQEIDEDGEEAAPAAEANEEVANTEELNRRIEEFIRKMKEEIRIEAQQQLIAV